MSYDRRDPNKAYLQASKDAERLANQVAFLVLKHADRTGGMASWGAVGDLTHVVHKLQELQEFLSQKPSR